MSLGIAAVFDAVEQLRMAAGPDLGVAEFAYQPVFHHAAKLRRHGLHAIADAQNGDAGLEHPLRGAWRAAFRDRGRPAREDDSPGREIAHEIVTDIVGMQFAVDT